MGSRVWQRAYIMMIELTSGERRVLRARAHGLNPVVSVAEQGLSPSVLKEIERSLDAHELIKVRVYGEDRDARAALLQSICDTLNAAPVQHIGNILVIYRQKPESLDEAAKPAAPKARGTGARSKSTTGGRTAGANPGTPMRAGSGVRRAAGGIAGRSTVSATGTRRNATSTARSAKAPLKTKTRGGR